MSLAVPSALIFGLVALPIIVFYILKVRLRRIPVSTNLFWKQIFDEKPPRSIWQQFRHLLSLLAQLLLLTLLVFALADPYFSWQALQARRIVVVVDNSASMQANDIASSRFESAIDAAVNLVDGMRFRDEMAIVTTGTRPEVILGMSGHAPTLKRALAEVVVTDNPTALGPAIELGKRLIGDHENGEVVVLTDGCSDHQDVEPAETVEQPEKNSPRIAYRMFATETAGNVGITQFQVRRSLVDMLGYELLVAVKNASDQPVKCRLEIELSGVPVDVLPLKLEPNELWSRSLEKTSLAGGTLVASIKQIEQNFDAEEQTDTESDDAAKLANSDSKALNALMADDQAWAILPTQKVQPVLLVTKGNLFLRKVFEANPLVNVSVTSEFPEQWPTDAIIVLHNQVPDELPAGNLFVVDPAGNCDAWELGGNLENPIVTEIAESSDLMTHVRLDNVLMPEARKLNFKTETKLLAGSISKDPVYVELKRGAAKALVLTVDLDKSDLTFRTAFPIMVTNALSWFAESSGELREANSTGRITTFELSKTDDAVKLVAPSSRSFEINTNSTIDNEQVGETSQVTIGPFDERGVWELQAEESGSETTKSSKRLIQQFAVNLSNVRESDLRPSEWMLEKKQVPPSIAGFFARPIWYYLIGLAGVFFLVEWFLYHRRFIT